MQGFLKSFTPLLNKLLKKYRAEAILVFVALLIAIISITIFFSEHSDQTTVNDEVSNSISQISPTKQTVVVDIAGAVGKPGVYEVTVGARLKDLLLLTNGLNSDADQAFFNRNFNLARYVSDQEKIYIPATWEIASGIFNENSHLLDYTSPVNLPNNNQSLTTPVTTESLGKISMNNGTVEELDTLVGVGKATATKIIQNRPYSSLEDLVNKKAVTKSVFEKIKNNINL